MWNLYIENIKISDQVIYQVSFEQVTESVSVITISELINVNEKRYQDHSPPYSDMFVLTCYILIG